MMKTVAKDKMILSAKDRNRKEAEILNQDHCLKGQCTRRKVLAELQKCLQILMTGITKSGDGNGLTQSSKV